MKSRSMRVHFGDFTLDDDRHELLRGGEPVHLSPKEYELLKLLIGARPKALSKEALHDALWPATFVSEVSLAAVVAHLRSALGESSRGRGLIRTIHGFGYAFVAEAVELGAAAGCWLVWRNERIPLHEGEQVIGRSSDVHIPLGAEKVSRRHARLNVTRSNVTVEDLGSKNGTWVDGVRVTEPVQLRDGDEIRLGPERLMFHTLRSATETKTNV